MKITTVKDKIMVAAPAKLNLFLEVGPRRADGYHDIETVMQAVSLYDQLVIEPGPGLNVVCHDLPELDTRDNLVYRAAERLKEKYRPAIGAHIVLYKRIPAGTGLGGGSSDAAATLAGLCHLWKLRPSRAALEEMAAELGSDVPFFLEGGSAVCRGRGEQVERVVSHGPWHYLLVVPPRRNKTSAVYERLDESGAYESMISKGTVEALSGGDFRELEKALFNRLEGPGKELNDEVGRCLEILGPGARMTGSGSACYRLCHDEIEAGEEKKRVESLLRGHIVLELTEDQMEAPQTFME